MSEKGEDDMNSSTIELQPICPKCHQSMRGPGFHRTNYDCLYGHRQKTRDEHLHYQCGCGYDMTTPTKDSTS